MRADVINGSLALLPQHLRDAEVRRVTRRLVAQAVTESKGRLTNGLSWAMDYSSSADSVMRSLAPDMLAVYDAPNARLALERLVADADPIVASSAAEQASKLKDATVCSAIRALLGRIAPEDVEALQTSIGAAAELKCPDLHLERFLASPNFTIRLAAAGAVESLTGSRPPIPEVSERPSVPNLDLPPRPHVTLTTRRGVIHLELFADDSPVTTKSFVALARKKFFDGLTFHRVVPDFVIQGGDPRGDGSGGPGYTIRCEINRHPYLPGAVGMALSGKDTGGSQFFITNSRQPHLDGKYTVFGHVVSGQEIVDSVLEGDEIVHVEEER
jgi:cyclophilin family peptidyl-prolyl cis-trans isomerase